MPDAARRSPAGWFSPAVCGVMKTLGIVQSSEAAGSGSSTVTSSAAAEIFPAFIVSISAASSATLPRATFTNIDDGFMAAKAAALISAQFDAVPVGKPHVKHRDVGLKSRNPRHRLCYRTGLPDDLELRVGAEEVDQSTPDDLVIIDEEDFHHVKALRRSWDMPDVLTIRSAVRRPTWNNAWCSDA